MMCDKSKVEGDVDVKLQDVQSLLEWFSKNTYRAEKGNVLGVVEKCKKLFELDYFYSVISNANGELSGNYPSSLIILESERAQGRDQSTPETTPENEPEDSDPLDSETLITSEDGDNIYKLISRENPENMTDEKLLKLRQLFSKACRARCRRRFPVPVILYKTKHICRSATTSGSYEVYGKAFCNYVYKMGVVSDTQNIDRSPGEEEPVVSQNQHDYDLIQNFRAQDIRLLQHLKVLTIVDLMVENKKTKYGIPVSSSEKVDKLQRYKEFDLLSLPYPGCEFFKDYKQNGYNGHDLKFQWNDYHDAEISVPKDLYQNTQTEWSTYRDWDLVTLTQKYLRLLLAHIREPKQQGLLIHCISGWDRTPLFVSLLRLSLWADGVIHQSLSAEQILYLTLAYDWMLFGHDLVDRLSKGEEIMYFCFDFLKYILDSEFSIEQRTDAAPIPPTKPQPQQLSRVRNDSDIQLEGVLLEGDVTSPEGSSWSLSSVGSSQSNKSHDNNPPAYFKVVQESWDDCNGAQYLNNRHRHHSLAQNHNSSSNGFSSNLVYSNGFGSKTVEPILASSSSRVDIPEGVNRTASTSSINSNGNGISHTPLSNGKGHSALTITASNNYPRPCASISTSSASSLLSSELGNGPSHLGRTSPVPVPVQNRMHPNYRPDSTSSASIGSWQLVIETGSMRETISSASDLGSASSHSHPSRRPVNGTADCIEASESSCTLVEDSQELESVDCPIRPDNTFSHRYSNGANGLIKGDGAALSCLSSSPVDLVRTEETHSSRRRNRLQTVRAHFYSVYTAVIRQNTSSGGLGSIIGNFATKVGIRSATYRDNNL